MNLLWSGIAKAMARDKRLAQRYILQTFWFAVGLYMNFWALNLVIRLYSALCGIIQHMSG